MTNAAYSLAVRGSAKTFSSGTALENIAPQRSLPAAVVEAVDPIVLDTRITEDGSSSGTGEGSVSKSRPLLPQHSPVRWF